GGGLLIEDRGLCFRERNDDGVDVLGCEFVSWIVARARLPSIRNAAVELEQILVEWARHSCLPDRHRARRKRADPNPVCLHWSWRTVAGSWRHEISGPDAIAMVSCHGDAVPAPRAKKGRVALRPASRPPFALRSPYR